MFSFIAGYLLGDSPALGADLLLIAPPLLVSIPFFVAYSICFPYRDPRTEDESTLSRQNENAAYFWASLTTTLAAVLLLFASKDRTGHWPGDLYWFGALLYGLGFHLYALYLLVRFRQKSAHRSIRHQLFWPVLLSIAVSLYAGLYFSELQTSLAPLVPLAVMFVLFVADAALTPPKMVLIVAFALLSGVGIVGGLTGQLDLIIGAHLADYFRVLLFCVGVSAYLAVFEAWRVTAFVAGLDCAADPSLASSGPEAPCRSSDWYRMNFAALIVSMLAVPVVFVFSSFGLVFIWGYFLHAALAYCVWYWAGYPRKRLEVRPWIWPKVIAGFAFLAVLVADSWTRVEVQGIMPSLISMTGFGVIFAIAVLLGALFRAALGRVVDGIQDHGIVPVFNRRTRFVGAVPMLALGICFALLLLLDTPVVPMLRNGSDMVSRATHTYTASLLFAGLSFAILLWDRFGPSRGGGPAVLATLAVLRPFTSLMVGVGAGLPIWYATRQPLQAAAVALPFVLAAAGGFALNDCHDVQKDVVNRKNRGLATGTLRVPQVLPLAASLLVGSAVAGLWVARSPIEALIFVSTTALLIAYNYVVRYASLYKVLLTALLCAAPFLLALSREPAALPAWLFPVAVLAFVCGREILMDVLDMPGDQAAGSRTFPVLFGERLAHRTAFGCFGISAGVLLVMTIAGARPATTALGLLALGGLLSVAGPTFYYRRTVERQMVDRCWLPMFIGILAFASLFGQ